MRILIFSSAFSVSLWFKKIFQGSLDFDAFALTTLAGGQGKGEDMTICAGSAQSSPTDESCYTLIAVRTPA
ncbi:MAG: hypothetical protein OHK0046_21730 [Anaerolineae bacterium]